MVLDIPCAREGVLQTVRRQIVGSFNLVHNSPDTLLASLLVPGQEMGVMFKRGDIALNHPNLFIVSIKKATASAVTTTVKEWMQTPEFRPPDSIGMVDNSGMVVAV
eukprot:scpid88186/ scgid26053/ 